MYTRDFVLAAVRVARYDVNSTCAYSNYDSFNFNIIALSANTPTHSIELHHTHQLKNHNQSHLHHTMFRYQPTRALQRLTRFTRPSPSVPRLLSTTPTLFAQKDAQDKDSLVPRSTEYSKSGSDDAAASSDAAFNPNKTSPEEAEATSEREAGGKDSTLNASPGNKDISEPNSPGVGGNGGAPEKKGSGGGSPEKRGGGKSG